MGFKVVSAMINCRGRARMEGRGEDGCSDD